MSEGDLDLADALLLANLQVKASCTRFRYLTEPHAFLKVKYRARRFIANRPALASRAIAQGTLGKLATT